MRSGQSAKPTLVSLARELGVSRQTVSNVINAPHLVKTETRARVQAAIERSGYQPSALGRALRTQRSMNLAYRITSSTDDIHGTVMDRFLHALTEAAQSSSYRITLLTADDHDREIAKLEDLRSMAAIDGCILTGTTHDDRRPAALADAGLPLVAFGRPWGAEPGGHAWVDVDCSAATFAATRALIERGHRAIGFLGWLPGVGTGEDRRDGWLRAIADLGGPSPDWSTQTVDGLQAGAAAAGTLRERGVTAVVCASDSLAVGAHRVFVNPAEPFVPVIGFDDTPVARALGISSCSQPVEEAARFCFSTLARVLAAPATDATQFQTLLPAELRLRNRPLV